MNNGRIFHFGNEKIQTYIDGLAKARRDSYYKSLKYKPVIYHLVKNIIPHKRMFEARLLWGPYRDISKNVRFLNKLWERKHRLVSNKK
jgi:hypothetical protein